jgi:hypothetical protein
MKMAQASQTQTVTLQATEEEEEIELTLFPEEMLVEQVARLEKELERARLNPDPSTKAALEKAKERIKVLEKSMAEAERKMETRVGSGVAVWVALVCGRVYVCT